jgi:hypothetical protein
MVAAQVNIEALRRDTVGPGLSGTLGTDLSVRTGNVQLVELGVHGRADLVRGRTSTFLVGGGSLGFLGGSQFTSDGLLHLRLAWILRPWLEPEWYAQVNYDKPRRLDFRALAGGGLRVRLFQDSAARLWAQSGLMLEHERLDLPAGATEPVKTTVVRSSSYLAFRVVAGDNLLVTTTTYMQPRVARPGDIRLLENLALAVSVTRAVAVTVTFDLRYDSEPPDGIRRLDTALVTGLTVSF